MCFVFLKISVPFWGVSDLLIIGQNILQKKLSNEDLDKQFKKYSTQLNEEVRKEQQLMAMTNDLYAKSFNIFEEQPVGDN